MSRPILHYPDQYYQETTPESLPSATSIYDFEWTWRESLLVIPLGLIVIGTILGNALVLYSAATRSPTFRLPTHFFIANLALADFLVGVLVMPFLAVLQVTGRWYFGPIYCESWTVIHFWLCSSSILSTCAVCIERYIGVRFPLKHKQIMSTQRIWGMIVGVWTLAGLLSIGCLYIWPQPKSPLPFTCAINQQIGHVIVAVVGILYIPAVIMIVLYMKIFAIASRHLKFVKKNSAIPSGTQPTPSRKKTMRDTFFIKSFLANPKLSFSEPETSSSVVSYSTGESPRGSDENLRQVSISHHQEEKKGSAVSTVTVASSTVPMVPTSSESTNWNASIVKNVQSKKQINLAKRLSLLVGILLATYLPFFTLYLVMAFHPGSIDARVFNAFGWIRYFNSCLNPFIYALAVPAYRKAMTEIIMNALGKLRCGKK